MPLERQLTRRATRGWSSSERDRLGSARKQSAGVAGSWVCEGTYDPWGLAELLWRFGTVCALLVAGAGGRVVRGEGRGVEVSRCRDVEDRG